MRDKKVKEAKKLVDLFYHCDVRFLAHELKVMDEQTARNRVFFVSAKEVLQLRTRQQNENQGKKVKREGR